MAKKPKKIIPITNNNQPKEGDLLYCKKTYSINLAGYKPISALTGYDGIAVLFKEGFSYKVIRIEEKYTYSNNYATKTPYVVWYIQYGYDKITRTKRSLYFRFEKMTNNFCTLKDARKLKLKKIQESNEKI